jgi:FdhD protein
MSEISRPLARLAFGPAAIEPGHRLLPEEVAVALSFNGSTHAVMMATPADLVDFGYGFALTEGIARPDEIESVDLLETPRGIDLQIWLSDPAAERQSQRRRTMAGPVGCGLCGLDSLEQALRDPAPVAASALRLSAAQICAAIAALPGHQPLHDATRAVHAAGFYCPGQGLVMVREDVGRHNALDKLIGGLIRGGGAAATSTATSTAAVSTAAVSAADGALVLTSRVSIDMVQKCAALGAPVLIAVSAPTAHAVRLAEAAGITLVALARANRFEVFTHSDRIEVPAHAV